MSGSLYISLQRSNITLFPLFTGGVLLTTFNHLDEVATSINSGSREFTGKSGMKREEAGLPQGHLAQEVAGGGCSPVHSPLTMPICGAVSLQMMPFFLRQVSSLTTCNLLSTHYFT